MAGVKRFAFLEGWYAFISELETQEEKLAAYETICRMAFLGRDGFELPPSANDKCSRLCKHIYLMLHGVLWHDFDSSNQDQESSAYGKIMNASGYGRPRKGETKEEYKERTESRRKEIKAQESLDMVIDDTEKGNEPKGNCGANLPVSPANDPAAENTMSPLVSPSVKERIERAQRSCWQDRIKNWEDLQKVIKECYFGSDMTLAYSQDFCRYAYYQLAKVQGWKNSITGKPIQGNLMNVIASMLRGFSIEQEKAKGFEKRRNIVKKTQAERVAVMEMEEADEEEREARRIARELEADRKAREAGRDEKIFEAAAKSNFRL